MDRRKCIIVSVFGLATMGLPLLAGCGTKAKEEAVEIELVQYKPEATAFFGELEEAFNETHDDIKLTISSPNDAMVVLKTRFIREDEPDMIGIGGDINYSYFMDADMLMDISDYEGLKDVKEAYLNIGKNLEIIPKEGVYGVPYAANAAGVLYNREMFLEHGWQIPDTYEEFLVLCGEIEEAGIKPLTFGYKDTWTCLSPWNSIVSSLTPDTLCHQVNQGNAVFKDYYNEAADIILQLQQYGQENAFAYGYNDACTAFARGEAAMYIIGSYAVPQILSVNPGLDIDSFVFPATDRKEDNLLTSGIDLQFCIMESCENKEAAYEVLAFLQQEENVQAYITAQNSIPCKEGDYEISAMLDGMEEAIAEGKMVDYQDHYYPSEMAVDALIQTYLLEQNKAEFLEKFDSDWVRYNRDIIAKVRQYELEHAVEQRRR